jgi:hypothetical protein
MLRKEGRTDGSTEGRTDSSVTIIIRIFIFFTFSQKKVVVEHFCEFDYTHDLCVSPANYNESQYFVLQSVDTTHSFSA